MATSRKKRVKESGKIIKKLTRKIFGGVGKNPQNALAKVKNSKGAVRPIRGTPITKPRGQPTQEEINAARRRETVRRTYASQNRARVSGPRLAAEKAAAEAAAARKAAQEAEAAARKAEQNRKDKEAANARAAEEAARAAAALQAEQNAANRAAALKAEQNAAKAAKEAANAEAAAKKAAEEEARAKAAQEEAAKAAAASEAEARRIKDAEERETVRRLAEQRRTEQEQKKKEEKAKQETISTVQEIQQSKPKKNEFTEQIRELEAMGSTQQQQSAFGTSAAQQGEEGYFGNFGNNTPEVYPQIPVLIGELEAMLPRNGKYSNTTEAERKMSEEYKEKRESILQLLIDLHFKKKLISREEYENYLNDINNLPVGRRNISTEKLEEKRKKVEENARRSKEQVAATIAASQEASAESKRLTNEALARSKEILARSQAASAAALPPFSAAALPATSSKRIPSDWPPFSAAALLATSSERIPSDWPPFSDTLDIDKSKLSFTKEQKEMLNEIDTLIAQNKKGGDIMLKMDKLFRSTGQNTPEEKFITELYEKFIRFNYIKQLESSAKRAAAESQKLKAKALPGSQAASAAAPAAISALPPSLPAAEQTPQERKRIEQVIENAEAAAAAANIRAAEEMQKLIESLQKTAQEASTSQNPEQAAEAGAEQILEKMKPIISELKGEAQATGLGGEEGPNFNYIASKEGQNLIYESLFAAFINVQATQEGAQEGNAVSIEMPSIEKTQEIIEETKRTNAETEQKLEIGDVSKNDVDNIMELHKQFKQMKEKFIGKRAELIELYKNEQDQERKTKLEQQVLQVDDVIDDLDRELTNITRVAYAVVKKYLEQKKKKAEENAAQASAGEKPIDEEATGEEPAAGEATSGEPTAGEAADEKPTGVKPTGEKPTQEENKALEALGNAVEAAEQAEEERPTNTSEGEAKKKQSLFEVIKQSILAIAYSKKAKKAKEEQNIEQVKGEIKEKITEAKKQSNFHQAKLMNNLVDIYYKDDNTIDLNKIKLIRDMVKIIITESSK